MTENRTELLLGSDAYSKLQSINVILFGVGGVGSWCAETLVRSGVKNLTIFDFDTVAQSNINRQLPATVDTIGELKVEVMRRRLLSINPEAEITAIADRFTADNASKWHLEQYHYIVDAIDSVADKARLILDACRARPAVLFSSMGAALKTDPLRVDVKEFWKVQGCPLAAALRRRFKRTGEYPAHKFKCVYSPELVRNAIVYPQGSTPNGTLAHITGIFGHTLASLVIRDAIKPENQ